VLNLSNHYYNIDFSARKNLENKFDIKIF